MQQARAIPIDTHIAGTAAGDVRYAWQPVLRQRLTWLLLVCYSLMLARPAMPVLADVVAHTLYEQQHLMTVHEEHGRFHIHYEQQKQGGEKSKPAAGYKYQADDYLHVSRQVLFLASSAVVQGKVYTCYTCYYPSSVPHKDHIPPRA